MSIATEINRLCIAKGELKSALEKRGVVVSDTDTIDSFGALLSSAPCAVKGAFTPEKDTAYFELSGLDFVPETLSVICNDFETNALANTICCVYVSKGKIGSLMYYDDTNKKSFVHVYSTADIALWSEDSVVVQIPSSRAFFKKGYTYDYVISGGFEK